MIHKTRMFKTAATATVVAGLIYGLISCSGERREPTEPEKLIPVKISAVARRNIAAPVFASGQLSPETVARLSFKTGGLIGRIYAKEGDDVQKGQLLAELDLSEIRSRVAQAENGFSKSKRDLERAENLYTDRAATLEQLQNARTARDVAEAELSIARFNLQHSRIAAPANGKILKRLAETGEMINSGMPVLLFGDTAGRWVVRAGISEKEIVRIRVNDPAVVELDAYPGKKFNGWVSEIPNALDPAAGSFETEIALNPDQTGETRLMAGFVAKVTIASSARDNFYIVPIDALVEGEGARGALFTVQNSKAKRLIVEIAHLLPETAAIRTGLENIDNVVTSGAAYLNDGVPVKVMERSPAPPEQSVFDGAHNQ